MHNHSICPLHLAYCHCKKLHRHNMSVDRLANDSYRRKMSYENIALFLKTHAGGEDKLNQLAYFTGNTTTQRVWHECNQEDRSCGKKTVVNCCYRNIPNHKRQKSGPGKEAKGRSHPRWTVSGTVAAWLKQHVVCKNRLFYCMASDSDIDVAG